MKGPKCKLYERIDQEIIVFWCNLNRGWCKQETQSLFKTRRKLTGEREKFCFNRHEIIFITPRKNRQAIETLSPLPCWYALSTRPPFLSALCIPIMIIEAWCIDSDRVSVSVTPCFHFQDSVLYVIQFQHVCPASRRSEISVWLFLLSLSRSRREPQLIENYIALSSSPPGEQFSSVEETSDSYASPSVSRSPFYFLPRRRCGTLGDEKATRLITRVITLDHKALPSSSAIASIDRA